MPADGFDKYWVPTRPQTAAPATSAPLADREAWSWVFTAWLLAMTGGDPEIEGVPTGQRWRMEYFDCVRDPQAFEKYAEEEVRAYQIQMKENDNGEGN